MTVPYYDTIRYNKNSSTLAISYLIHKSTSLQLCPVYYSLKDKKSPLSITGNRWSMKGSEWEKSKARDREMGETGREQVAEGLT